MCFALRSGESIGARTFLSASLSRPGDWRTEMSALQLQDQEQTPNKGSIANQGASGNWKFVLHVCLETRFHSRAQKIKP